MCVRHGVDGLQAATLPCSRGIHAIPTGAGYVGHIAGNPDPHRDAGLKFDDFIEIGSMSITFEPKWLRAGCRMMFLLFNAYCYCPLILPVLLPIAIANCYCLVATAQGSRGHQSHKVLFQSKLCIESMLSWQHLCLSPMLTAHI